MLEVLESAHCDGKMCGADWKEKGLVGRGEVSCVVEEVKHHESETQARILESAQPSGAASSTSTELNDYGNHHLTCKHDNRYVIKTRASLIFIYYRHPTATTQQVKSKNCNLLSLQAGVRQDRCCGTLSCSPPTPNHRSARDNIRYSSQMTDASYS